MNERQLASRGVNDAIKLLQDRFGTRQDRLEVLMVLADSLRQWRHAPERYLKRPELLPLMLEEVLHRIQLERDRRAGNIH